jgi:hypothetical protein
MPPSDSPTPVDREHPRPERETPDYAFHRVVDPATLERQPRRRSSLIARISRAVRALRRAD